MEDILSSIKRIIAEEGDPAPRPRRAPMRSVASEDEAREEVLELSHPMPPAREQGATESTPVIEPSPAIPTPGMGAGLSPETTVAARGALDSLSRLIVRAEPANDGTLEGLVRELLRPMLSEWLDAKLPAIVEAMVAREIAKITGSGR